MVEETLVAGGVRFRPLVAGYQEFQSASGDLGGKLANDDAALHYDRNGGKSHADGSDARWCACLCLVSNQPVVRIRALQIVEQGRELKATEVLFRRHSVQFEIG